MLKNFLIKRVLKSQIKSVPAADQEKVMALLDKNPDLFMKIADEVQKKMKEGKSQMTASMEVMKLHEAELREIMK